MDPSDSRLMRSAIEEASRSTEPLKCGVVIAKDGKIIAMTHNSQRASNDASAHAEINAVRQAGAILGDKNLTDCVIYCTCEPCVMCLSAISFAKISRLVYGVALKDVSPKDKRIDIDIDTFLSRSPNKIEVVRGFYEGECRLIV